MFVQNMLYLASLLELVQVQDPGFKQASDIVERPVEWIWQGMVKDYMAYLLLLLKKL